MQELSTKTIIEVLKYYNLGAFKSISPISGGLVNGNYKLVTVSGNYFLKEYRFPNKSEMIWVNNILLDLKKRGEVPVAAPFLTNQHETALLLNKRLFAIFEFKEGDCETSRDTRLHPEKIISAAKTLAKLHKHPIKIPSNKEIISKCLKTEYIDKMIVELEKLAHKKNHSDLEKFTLSYYHELVHHWKSFYKDLKYVRKNRALNSIGHGDFWSGQLLFNTNDVVALIDFDAMRFEWAEYDLMKGITLMTHNNGNLINKFARSIKKEYHIKDYYDLVSFKKFLLAYKEIYGKIDIHPREIFAFIKHARLSSLQFFILHKGPDATNRKEVKLVKKVIHQTIKELNWVEKNEERILKLINEINRKQ